MLQIHDLTAIAQDKKTVRITELCDVLHSVEMTKKQIAELIAGLQEVHGEMEDTPNGSRMQV